MKELPAPFYQKIKNRPLPNDYVHTYTYKIYIYIYMYIYIYIYIK